MKDLRFAATGTEADPGRSMVYAETLGGLAVLAEAVDRTPAERDVVTLGTAAAAHPWLRTILDAVTRSRSLTCRRSSRELVPRRRSGAASTPGAHFLGPSRDGFSWSVGGCGYQSSIERSRSSISAVVGAVAGPRRVTAIAEAWLARLAAPIGSLPRASAAAEHTAMCVARAVVSTASTGKPGTCTVLHVAVSAENAFWTWVIVEVLRLGGLRVEELLELTQLSFRQYPRPNGEVIGLLVIAPSKTDRERVIPMSAELFHVIAVIIRRLTREWRRRRLGRSRWPPATTTAVTSDPQPFLFQRRIGQRVEVITPGALRESSPALPAPRRDTSGLPTPTSRRTTSAALWPPIWPTPGCPSISARRCSGTQLQTFHGYVTVFNEDVVRHYQSHLAKRRAMRPDREYRPATAAEWDEFEQHFDKRKVELGQCGRPYATPCAHEHACLRCPMLRIDPRMLARLDELESDLSPAANAPAEGWLGELEGLDLTLTRLRDKRYQAQRAAGLDPATPA